MAKVIGKSKGMNGLVGFKLEATEKILSSFIKLNIADYTAHFYALQQLYDRSS